MIINNDYNDNENDHNENNNNNNNVIILILNSDIISYIINLMIPTT
jgi:hypothetical protein